MLNNLAILIVLLPLCCSHLISSHFCKRSQTECSQRIAPHTHQCGPSVCTRNRTECKEYLKVEKIMKKYQLVEFVESMSPTRKHHNEMKLEQDFLLFLSKLKACSQKANTRNSSEMCARGTHCLQNQVEYIRTVMYFRLKKFKAHVDCPCPANQSYVCGRQSELCSASREACESFSSRNKKSYPVSAKTLVGIKKCENDFILIE